MNVFGPPEGHDDSVNAYLLDLAKDVATLVDGRPAVMERFREQIGVYAKTWERWAEAQRAEQGNRWTPAVDRLENPLAVFALGGFYSAEREARQLPGFYSLVAFLHDRELPHLEKINNGVVISVEVIQKTLLAPGNELEEVNALRSDISCMPEAYAIAECLNWVSIDLRDFIEQNNAQNGPSAAELGQRIKAMSDAKLFRHLAQMLERRPHLALLKDRTWRGVDRALAPWFGEAIERLKGTREKEVESLKYKYRDFVVDVRRRQTKNVRGRGVGFGIRDFDYAGELADSFALLALEAERESESERLPEPTREDGLARLIQKLEEVERRKENYQYRYPDLSYGGIPEPGGGSYWKERVQPWIDDVELDLAQIGATVKPQWPYPSLSWEQAAAIVRQGRKPESMRMVIQGLKVVQALLRGGDGAAGKEGEKLEREPNKQRQANGQTADPDVRQIEDYAGAVEAVASEVVHGSFRVRSYEDLAKITGDEGLLSGRRASEAAEKMGFVRHEGQSQLRKTYWECIARPIFEDGWAKVKDKVEQIDYQTAEKLNEKLRQIRWYSNGGSPERWIECREGTCGPKEKLQELIRSFANGLRYVARKARENRPGQPTHTPKSSEPTPPESGMRKQPAERLKTDTQSMGWDVFISHASEDKEAFVRLLAIALREKGIRVWFDEFTLTVGDSLRRSIDRGLASSRYGIVIISPDFLKKDWPQKELDGLFAQEVGDRKVILPVWHNVDDKTVREYSPLLADRLAIPSAKGVDGVVADLMKVIKWEN